MTGLREQKHHFSRNYILDTANQILANKGYAEMTMDEVSLQAGISKATLYQYFPSKDELTIAVVEKVIGQELEMVRSLDPGIPPLQRLEMMLREGLRQSHLHGLSLAPKIPVSLWKDPRLSSVRQDILGSLSELLAEACAAGSIQPALPLPVIAELVTGAFNVNVQEMMRVLNLPYDAVIDRILQGLLYGIAQVTVPGQASAAGEGSARSGPSERI